MSFSPRTAEELALTFPPELAHVSASSLGMAHRCEEQWRQRYILGRIEPPSLNLTFGGADHKAIEASLAQKIDTGEDLPVGVVRDLFLNEVETRVENAGGLKEYEIKNATTKVAKQKVYDEGRTRGIELVGLYQQNESPLITPLAVEEEFNVELPDLPVVMKGFIDIMAQRSSGNVIIDRKRSGQAVTKPKAEWALQAEIYQMVKGLPFEWHLSITGGKVARIVRGEELTKTVPPFERSLRLVQQLVAKLGFLYMRYGPDEPWPATGKLHTWACNYCGYRPDCWGWKEE